MGGILALDVGTKTIGIAVGSTEARIPRPHSTLSRKGVKRDVVRLQSLCVSLAVESVVVGLPYELDGSEGRSARLARQVGDALGASTGLPIHYQDERYSTLEAEHRLRAAGKSTRAMRSIIDQEAAAVILGDWFNQSE